MLIKLQAGVVRRSKPTGRKEVAYLEQAAAIVAAAAAEKDSKSLGGADIIVGISWEKQLAH